jgi:hypothetical protein
MSRAHTIVLGHPVLIDMTENHLEDAQDNSHTIIQHWMYFYCSLKAHNAFNAVR